MVPGDAHSKERITLEMIETKDWKQSVYDIHCDNGRDRYIFASVGEGADIWGLTRKMVECPSDVLAYYWKYPIGSGCEPRAMGGSFKEDGSLEASLKVIIDTGQMNVTSRYEVGWGSSKHQSLPT